ncbi:hypothetical protein PDIG_70330 [Penicillium digitatum PHI26]|uniref:Uncharacterized protein n=2 Tax=Penicillium digitatum TaxID=36651 RepID=K9FIF9_PEND2|nr:hypothetical protein PDIP_79640 [Penicillium digitatum Pd1]EKV06339.1 hypothetical protein PDIP_79640 [Penicillium digitatum Pd1]EKV07957.1 hypothetical protein PDIG_70330 [Penicillium digitatum PHI26]
MDSSDRMLCHACGGVWIKNDDLTCPHCESEFTEIVQRMLSLLISFILTLSFTLRLRFLQNYLPRASPHTMLTPRRLHASTHG